MAEERMKDLSPYPERHRIFLIPELDDALSNARHVERETPTFREYWQIVRKHRGKIIACFLAAVLGTGLYVFSRIPLYTAKATLLIERKGPQVVNIQQVLSESVESDDHNFYESQYEMLKSRSLAAEVIKNQGLDKNPVFINQVEQKNLLGRWFNPQDWLIMQGGRVREAAQMNNGPTDSLEENSRSIDAYEGMLEIQPLKRSRLVKIAVSAPDPRLAASIANAHANAYVHQGMQLKSQANQEARQFLDAKLTELKDKLEKSEDALNQFRHGKGIISLDDKENVVVDRLADLNKRLTEAEADRIGLESQARLIKQRDYDSLPAVISNPLIQNLKAQVVNLEAEYANLSAQFKLGYPRLAQLKAQLDEAKQRLAQQIKSVVGGINSAYYASAGKEKDLRVQMNKQKAEALALKDASVEYAILDREVDTNSQLYDSVLQRIKEIAVASEIPASNVSILDRAEIPRLSSYPQKKLAILFAALVGLMGGLGLAFISEYFDKTLRTPADVEHYLRIPNLVVVPDFFSLPKGSSAWKSLIHRRGTRPAARLCVPDESSAPSDARIPMIMEAYRKLRTSISLSAAERLPQTILFTSGAAGEGKTMTIANTAIMFAQLGHKVLVVDADMRRPSCHKALRLSNRCGLTDYLAGNEELENAIQPSSIPNLRVLSCGSIPSNPTEMIGSRKMQEMLGFLKDHYDFILIDSPPVLPVTDAVVLASIADGVVFIVRGQETPKHLVKAAISELNQKRNNILGVVLNRVNIRSAEYADYHQYYDPRYYYSSAKLT